MMSEVKSVESRSIKSAPQELTVRKVDFMFTTLFKQLQNDSQSPDDTDMPEVAGRNIVQALN